jgi:glycerophosphoryl diester phosphodiesterase
MNRPKKIIIQGHRGARGLLPENTIPSFLEAVRLGVDTLETDVVISKDNQVVISHEPWMNPLFCTRPDGVAVENNSEKKYNLYRMTYAEIAKFDCGIRGNKEFPQQKAIAAHKPLLSEMISKVDAYTKENNLPSIKYNIEIKSELDGDGIFHPAPQEFAKLVYDEVARYKILDRCNLQSFDVRILQEIKKLNPSIRLALLLENHDSLETNLGYLGFIPEIYSPEFILVTEDLVGKVHDKGMQLIPWTVNEVSDMKKLISMGVDGLITDYPDRAIALVKANN